ncbi:MAG: hypothetical protein ACYTAO_23140, partial [Planctomycetota bacterium]
LLRAEDAIPDFEPPRNRRDTTVIGKSETAPPPIKAAGKQCISEELLDDWGSFVVWNKRNDALAAVTRDDVGKYFKADDIDPELDGEYDIEIDGKTVKVRTVYSLTAQYLSESFDLESTSKITWAPKEAIVSLARQIAQNNGKTLIAVGPEQRQDAHRSRHGTEPILQR